MFWRKIFIILLLSFFILPKQASAIIDSEKVESCSKLGCLGQEACSAFQGGGVKDSDGNYYCLDTDCKNGDTCVFVDRKCNTEEDCTGYSTQEGGQACLNNHCYLDAVGKENYDKGGTVGFTDVKVDLRIKEPKLTIGIPGLNFSKLSSSTVTQENGRTYLNIPYIGEYIAAAYKVGLVVISIIAVVMIIVTGIKIIVSGGEGKVEGFKRIGQIAVGLFIGWGSFTILSIVNPTLVNFQALRVQYIDPIPLQEGYDAAASVAALDLASMPGVIPQLTNGKYSENLKVPLASTCNHDLCIKKGRCVDQAKRDMAYEAQLKTGYPAAVMLAQYLVEGATFGLTCSGGFVPSEKQSVDSAQAQQAIDTVNCPQFGNCGPGFTWECTNKAKYLPPKAKEDFNKSGDTINCGKGDKATQGYVRVHGYRCFRKPVSEGNIFAPLVEFYEKRKCFKSARDQYGGNPAAYAVAVQKCGYATAQTYANSLVDKMNDFCLTETKQTLPNAPAPAAPANDSDDGTKTE